MPTVPTNQKCSTLGCKNTKARFSSLCTEHGGRDTFDHKRYNNSKHRQDSLYKYHSTQWRSFRHIQLSKHPLCASCESDGIITAAQHVDHVFPWSIVGEHAFLHNIFQSLCASCHTSKTQLEQKGIFRHYGQRDYIAKDFQQAVGKAYM